MQNLIGKQFGQYQIISQIGQGGMGSVYQARDTRLAREVAIKILPPDLARDGEFVQRFIREANTAAGLDHPNIIAIHNVGTQDNLHYIVMRLAQGETLNELIRQSGALSLARALKIVEQLADALNYAHQRQIIHRDIKPANIMVGDNDRVTLMDFGIAKPISSKLTRAGTMIGTPEYMSPEQFTGALVDSRADLYALGIVAYEMLTGCLPFSGDTPLTVSHKQVNEPPPSLRQYNPQIPIEVEQVIMRCLAKRPQERYQSANELSQALRAAVLGGGPAAPAPSPPAADRLKLVLSNGQEHPLERGVINIGRAANNQLVVNDSRVSRCHAEIRSDARGMVIIDQGSSNGTFLNGQRLTPHTPYPLQPGAQIRLGPNVSMSVEWGAALPGGQAPAAPAAPIKTTQQEGDSAPAFRPTAYLAKMATGLSNTQLALALGALLLLTALAVWFGAPLMRKQKQLWNNLPLIAIVGPLAYSATRRRWTTLLAHSLIALIGGALLWQRVGYEKNYALLLTGALASGAFMELTVALTPRIKGKWFLEMLWLALVACLGVAILYGLSIGPGELERIGQWVGAIALGSVGWFLGDLFQQYITLRRSP